MPPRGRPKASTPPPETDHNDPNSPAPIPTETPAPTPVRPSTGTLPTRGRGGVRGGRGGRGASAAAPSKFKPKIIRREQSEREELAREELKRKQDAADAAAREEARASRGRGRGFPGRGRGDAMGRGREQQRTTSTGVFGVLPAAMQKKSGIGISSSGKGSGSGAGGGSSGGSGAGGARIKTEGGITSFGGRAGRDTKNFVPEPEYPEDDDIPRVDIERINLISDDEDDDTPKFLGSLKVNKGKGPSRGGLKPVRLDRVEHKERVTVVNTDPDTKLPAAKEADDEDTPMVDEQRSALPQPQVVEEKEFKGVYQDLDDGVKIKSEPGLSEPHREAIPDAPLKVPGSPEDFKKRPQELASSPSAIDIETPEPNDEALAKVKVKKARRHSKKKDHKPVIQTEEDRAEYERHLEDVQILARELGGMQDRTRDNDGDVAMEGAAEQEQGSQREGRLYLFQFPPVLPKLYNPLKEDKPVAKPDPKSKSHSNNEKDKEMDKGAKDAEMTGTNAKPKAQDGKEIKTEEDLPAAKEKDEKEKVKKREEVCTEEGYVGKLIVRESGKVELSWGGTSMVVGRGVDAGFLTMGVLVDKDEIGAGANGGEGKALGMGKIMGKFVVTPDWEKMM